MKPGALHYLYDVGGNAEPKPVAADVRLSILLFALDSPLTDDNGTLIHMLIRVQSVHHMKRLKLSIQREERGEHVRCTGTMACEPKDPSVRIVRTTGFVSKDSGGIASRACAAPHKSTDFIVRHT